MNVTPIEIKRHLTGINIKWADGQVTHLSSEKLRRNCPCAGCREARGDTNHKAPLGTSEPKQKKALNIVTSSLAQELELIRIWPIGNYALGMEWADGHSTGIYTYKYLAELGTTCPDSAADSYQ